MRASPGPADAVSDDLGDVLIDGDDILGDGVNVAARLEGIAEPGGICISASAYDQVHGKVPSGVKVPTIWLTASSLKPSKR
jgi:class 3 adenylate cyclase